MNRHGQQSRNTNRQAGQPIKRGGAHVLAAIVFIAVFASDSTDASPQANVRVDSGGLAVAAAAPGTAVSSLECNEDLKAVFQNDRDVQVLLVKKFAKGSELALNEPPSNRVAANNLCLVKLNVGPGNPGPIDAPSTSNGVGIEIWLPEPVNWNKRIHIVGGGGFMGYADVKSVTSLKMPWRRFRDSAEIAGNEGAVSAFTDGGHTSSSAMPITDGSFAMLPDGNINKTLLRDLSSRALHEMVVITKKLTAAFYGEAARYSYFEGCSTGGRQGHKAAQVYPDDFDGILAGCSAINWTRFITYELYPQVVMQRDLGGVPLTPAQLDLASAHAVSACDSTLNGRHDGFISDPGRCRYDPSKDKAILCKTSGGSNATAACLSAKQALAINKMWYGQTADGRAPDPAKSNGYSDRLDQGQLWYGLTRGADLGSTPKITLAAAQNGIPAPFQIATHHIALVAQDPTLADPSFRNARGNGADGWKSLSYTDLARLSARGAELQPDFDYINSDAPNLSRFQARGGKMIAWHGMTDEMIPPQGSLDYYQRVADRMGGDDRIQDFYRLYLIPGMGHCFKASSVNGLPGVSPPTNPPLPTLDQLYQTLVAWVEKGRKPNDIVISSRDGVVQRPICPFPTKIRYKGGNRTKASSYICK